MKKALSFFVLALVLFAATPAHADIFESRETGYLKASAKAEAPTVSAPYVDPQTILDYLAAISGYLGVKEGFFYDVDQEEFANYLAATIYTIPDVGIAVNFGAVDTDGIIASLDWNLGAAIPADDVPLLALVEYLYVGVGAGYRSLDLDNDGSDSWEFAYGPTVVFKATF